MSFSLLKHHFDLNITDTALKVSQSLYCFTTSISHGVENYFPRLWGTGISDAIFKSSCLCLLVFAFAYSFCMFIYLFTLFTAPSLWSCTTFLPPCGDVNSTHCTASYLWYMVFSCLSLPASPWP